jgi:DNA mismatch endonuclease, patch repair protein
LDTISKERRSYTMSRIRSKNTKPEKILRSALFKEGLRYRLHSKHLPGKPDIVFPRHKVAVFVHGCFWHLHKGCRDGRLPKSRLEYWMPKLNRNVERDFSNQNALASQGWNVITVWECEIHKHLAEAISRVKSSLKCHAPRKCFNA